MFKDMLRVDTGSDKLDTLTAHLPQELLAALIDECHIVQVHQTLLSVERIARVLPT